MSPVSPSRLRRLSTLAIGSALLVFGLACTGVGGGSMDVAAADRDVTFKRFQHQFDQSQVLDFVGEDTVQIYFGGRIDNRKTRVGTWKQSGREVQIWLDELEGVSDVHSLELWGRTIGQCSIAIYYRELSDGNTWTSGTANDDGGLKQPWLYHQSWPPCEAD